MGSRFFLGMLVGGCLWLGAASVQAQKPKVVVMDYTGNDGAKARVQVVRGLRDKVTFETRSAGKKVLAAEGQKLSSVAGRAAIAEGLGVDYVVWGRVRGRGSSARAEIRISGPEGREITSRDAGPPGQSKGNARIQKASRAVLAKAMTAAAPSGAVAATTAAAATPVALDEIRITLEEPRPAYNTDESKPEESPKKTEKTSKNPRTDTEPTAPILNLVGGAGGRVRNIDVNIDDGAAGTATRTYDSSIFLDIVFRLELRPLAKHEIKGLRGLALEADADFGIGLEARTLGSSATLNVKTWRILGQLGYFHPFGKHELGGLIGIGYDELDIEDNGSLPSIAYLYLRLGPAYRYFFIERLLYLRVDGGFRYPFSYGDLSDTFGPAKGFGFDAALTVGGELDVGFSYAMRLAFDYFKPQFSGFSGGGVPPLPGAAQGRDATDFATSFHAMVGWAF
jgi:hypothetical protein